MREVSGQGELGSYGSQKCPARATHIPPNVPQDRCVDDLNVDTSKCEDMQDMFHGAPSFSSDLSKWDKSKCEYFRSMFDGATAMSSSHKPTSPKVLSNPNQPTNFHTNPPAYYPSRTPSSSPLTVIIPPFWCSELRKNGTAFSLPPNCMTRRNNEEEDRFSHNPCQLHTLIPRFGQQTTPLAIS